MEGGIFDGDILSSTCSLTAEENSIVVAAINELTVKRLVRNNNRPLLHLRIRSTLIYRYIWARRMVIWGVVIGNFHWQNSYARHSRALWGRQTLRENLTGKVNGTQPL